MKSIVPSPRGKVRTAAAASLPVLARIPDVSEPEPEPIAPPQQPETDEVVTKKMDDRQPQAQAETAGRPIPGQTVEHARPQERTRQPRLPQTKNLRPTSKRSPRDQRRLALPPITYLLAGLLAVLLIVVVVLLTRNHDSAPDSQQSPGWPSAHDNYADSGSQHDHEMSPGEPSGMEMPSSLGQDPGDTAGMEMPNTAPPDFAPQTGQTSDVAPPGVVQLNGTIEKPDWQAQRPRENGVYAPR